MRDTIEIVKQIKEEGFAPVLLFPETRRLIELVRADEREACAKVADYYASGMDRNYSEIIADAIRARGETK